MLNIFELFSERYISRLIELKKIYLVTQTYFIGRDHLEKKETVRLLVTDYDDIGLATVHKAAVKHDRYAAILNLTNEKHLITLKKILAEDSEYLVYWALVKDRTRFKKRLDLRYKDNIRRYILQNTSWRISAEESIRSKVQVIFGELSVILIRGSQELKVKFADIEKS